MWAKNSIYFSIDDLVTVSGTKACDMSEVSEPCIIKMQNLHSDAFKYFLPNFYDPFCSYVACYLHKLGELRGQNLYSSTYSCVAFVYVF